MPVAADSCADASIMSFICCSVRPMAASTACWLMISSSPNSERPCSSAACAIKRFCTSSRPLRALRSLASACICVSAVFTDTAAKATSGPVTYFVSAEPIFFMLFATSFAFFSTLLSSLVACAPLAVILTLSDANLLLIVRYAVIKFERRLTACLEIVFCEHIAHTLCVARQRHQLLWAYRPLAVRR